MIAEGIKVISMALAGRAQLKELYLGPGHSPSIEKQARSAGAVVHALAPGAIERVASTVTPQPEIAVFARPAFSFDDLRAASMIVVGVEIQDPGNAGTMIRSGLASGAAGIVFCEGSVDVFSPKTVRSSAGTVFALPVLTDVPAKEALAQAKNLGLARVGALAGAVDGYTSVDLSLPMALIMGNEAHGLSPDVQAELDRAVSIPMAPGAESLNVGVATAVICFEADRQRRARSPSQ